MDYIAIGKKFKFLLIVVKFLVKKSCKVARYFLGLRA